MRKQFPFEQGNHKPARVVELIKSDVRKYVKRERRKKLPEDVDFWDFACRSGKSEAEAVSLHLEEIVPAIDTAAAEKWPGIYIEILAKPGVRKKTLPKSSTPSKDSTL